MKLTDETIPLAEAEAAQSSRELLADLTQIMLSETSDATQSTRPYYAQDHLPALPPSHSYKRTPVYSMVTTAAQAEAARLPLKDITIGSGRQDTVNLAVNTADARIALLDSRIKTTRLVEASLQNLMGATSKAYQREHSKDAEPADMSMDGTQLDTANTAEAMAVLLKKYENDAAVCNFEVDWYAPGGVSVMTAAAGTAAAHIQAQIAQRKKGRWR